MSNLLYNQDHIVYQTDNSETDSDFSEDDNQQSFLLKNEDVKYEINKIQVLVDTTTRDWVNSYKSVFDFQVRFNASETSFEDIRTTTLKHIKNEYGTLVSIYNEKSEIKTYQGSNALSIPISIKNIKSLYLEKMLIPNRKVYLEEGNYVNLLDFPLLSIHIDEFSNIVYGSNSNLNNSFANMISLSSVYNHNTTIQKFIELKNITRLPKVFKPVPLNTLNTLTIKIKDNMGNQLKFRDEQLEIEKIEYENSSSGVSKNYLKITTKTYFSRLDYLEGDIIIFKNIKLDTINSTLINYLERENGHKIYFSNIFTEKKNIESLNDLVNVFYITNKSTHTTGTFAIDSDYTSMDFTGISGNILNKNLQVIMYFTIENVEKSFANLNSQII
tara:strand:+ start:1310 stop:2467 length:1158 start_codon:yes stop_codon:yes gene_type:complete